MHSPHTPRALGHLSNTLFVILLGCCMALLAWLGARSEVRWDLTSNRAHTLSPDGQRLIALADRKLTVLAFASSHAMRQRIQGFIDLYGEHKGDLELEFIDPWQRPDEVSRHKITAAGELVLLHDGRSVSLRPRGQGQMARMFSERQFNAALQKLLRARDQTIYFIEGHGERSISGRTNHGLSAWAEQLRKRGLNVASLTVSGDEAIPEDASLVVLSVPQLDWLLPELLALRQYVERGGALLWLHDPGSIHGLEPLARLLGIGFGAEELRAAKPLPGNSDTRLVSPGLDSYSKHPIMREFRFRTLFPQAAAVEPRADDEARAGWAYSPLITAGEQPGAVALAMQREVEGRDSPQRAVVVGDGDFLSNTFLANGGNNELGVRLVEWLTGNDSLMATLEDSATDVTLEMSERGRAAFALSYLVGLPALLLMCAWLMRLRRKP